MKDKADLLVYWGADPPNTHPRHLSLHSYYAYTDYNPAGWYPRVTLACVEVRRTELSSMSKPVFRLKPGGDKAFTEAIVGEAQDEAGMARTFGELVRKSRFCVVFCGLGLVHGLGGDFRSFVRMVRDARRVDPNGGDPHDIGDQHEGVLPTAPPEDRAGQQRELQRTEPPAGREHSFLEQVRRQSADCIVIIGSDPFSALPHSVMSNLAATKIICLSPFATPSTMAADVVVPTALPGVECGGSVLRMDGVEVALAELEKREYPTEEAVLSQFLEST